MAKETAAARKKREAAEAKKAATVGRDLLAEAVNASNTGAPLMATEAEMATLFNDPRGPLVEHNANMRQGDKIAYRATALGMQAFAERNTPQSAQVPSGWGSPAPAVATPAVPPAATGGAPAASGGASEGGSVTPKYQFETGIPIPPGRRGGRGATVYGFEQMVVGGSFFVPSTTDQPNPAKSIASTVSSASQRLEPRKFIVRSVDEPGRGKGARVWRTE